jgi:hypothetical protein
MREARALLTRAKSHVPGDLFQEITRYLNTPQITCEEMAARINAANNYAFDQATLRRIAEALV